MSSRLVCSLAVFVCCTALSVRSFGQKVTVGVITGASLSDDFRSASITYLGGTTRYVSNASERFMVGPTVELAFPTHISVEVDAIHRKIRSRQLTVYGQPLELPTGVVVRSYGPVIADEFAWQFSALGKYTVTGHNVKQFVESGLSFLPRENRDQTGITIGSGVELPMWRLKLSPALRYTRWLNNDNLGAVNDQFQLVVGVHERSESIRPRAFGRELRLGFIAGFGITKLLRDDVEPVFAFAETSDSHTPIGGLLIGIPLRDHLSLEVEGLYRPTHRFDATVQDPVRSAFLTWQIPVLAIYEVPITRTNRVAPAMELGPSFRAIAHANSEAHSHHGVTGGLGVATHVRGFTVTPRIRHTRWAADPRDRFGRERVDATRPNQWELLVGFSF